MRPELEYRIVTTVSEMAKMEELQRKIWGASSVSPIPQLMAAAHNGGVVIAARHGGMPVGFCYGFAGFQRGKAYLCSHMLGILPDYRDWGIGRQLKLRQREWAMQHGYDKMTWTYDPLEARNAYLNLCKLGGTVSTYIESYYGDMGDGINKGLPSDRFVLEWDLSSEQTVRCLDGAVQDQSDWREYPLVLGWEYNGEFPRPVTREPFVGLPPLSGESPLAMQQGILLSVPAAIHPLKQAQPAIAMEWRLALRSLCQEAFSQGYVAVGLLRNDEPVHAYVLERKGGRMA